MLFLAGWNFYFPTPAERILWRVFAVYHAAFSAYGTSYYCIELIRSNKRLKDPPDPHQQSNSIHVVMDSIVKRSDRKWLTLPIVARFLEKWEATLPIQDPEDRVKIRVLAPITITCALYCFCRLFIYVEDFVSLREQKSGVYYNANLFVWNSVS
jgi:hypothetical protein